MNDEKSRNQPKAGSLPIELLTMRRIQLGEILEDDAPGLHFLLSVYNVRQLK